MILTVTMNPALDRIYVIDDFKVDALYRIENMEINAAGKGINVARVLNQLGEEVTATGILGGSTGKYLDKELQQTQIISDFVEIKENIRTCIKVVDNKNDTTTEMLESGPRLETEEKNQFLTNYQKLIPESEIIAACGSLPQGLEDDFYKELITRANQENKKFILDTSGIPLKKAVASVPFMIKPNEDEIEFLMEKNYQEIQEYVEPLEFLKELGIELPVITLGEKGCVALIKGKAFHFPALSVSVKNVVGSGDAFTAGCASALSENKDYKQVIKKGMACALANTQFYKTGMVTSELVEKYYHQLQSKLL